MDLCDWDVNKFRRVGYSDWIKADIQLEECPTCHGLFSGVTTNHVTSANSGLTKQKNTFGVILRTASGVADPNQGIMNIENTSN